jgi:hemolysin D
MNERAAPPPVSSPPPKGKPATSLLPTITGRDREFLPAALEILETPPAPLPVALMLTICAFVLVALAWSFIGRLDVHAVAPGKIENAGHAKLIQPLDPGKIASIHVENGAHVQVGDLLLELDPAEARADEKGADDAMNASLAEVARRRAAIAAVDAKAQGATLSPLEKLAADPSGRIAWDAAIPESFRLREQAVLAADVSQLSDVVNNLGKQMAQKEATRERLRMSIGYQNTLIETMTQHVHTRQEAIDLKVGTKINLYDAKEQLEKSQSALASDQGQLIETDAALRELQSQKTKALSQFIADNENKASEAARKADEARQNKNKAAARLARTKLYSPIDGVVQQMAVTTVGQVVTTGQQLLVVTPRDGRLQVEALVANLDIGFIKLGQEAAVKVDAFPFTRFGVLHGKVVRIAAEAIDEQAAKRAFANAAAAANNANAALANSQPGQPESFVFPVIVELEESSIKAGDSVIPLTAGMTVSVEIKTQQRRVIDYFLSPLAKVTSEALSEQ